MFEIKIAEPTKIKEPIFVLIRLSFLLSEFANHKFTEIVFPVKRVVLCSVSQLASRLAFLVGNQLVTLCHLGSLHIHK